MKLKLEGDRQVYITSDTHYGHKNIIKTLSDWKSGNMRDFQSIDHMNESIVNNINRVVRKDDILLHLGDWSFGGIDNIFQFRERVNCENIILIYGNHDDHIKKNKDKTQSLFSSTHQYLELTVQYPDKTQLELILFHYPISSWNKLGKGRVHLHGHIHSLPFNKIRNRALDVGMDGNNMEVYNIKDAYNLVCNNKVDGIYIKEDHHVKDNKSQRS